MQHRSHWRKPCQLRNSFLIVPCDNWIERWVDTFSFWLVFEIVTNVSAMSDCCERHMLDLQLEGWRRQMQNPRSRRNGEGSWGADGAKSNTHCFGWMLWSVSRMCWKHVQWWISAHQACSHHTSGVPANTCVSLVSHMMCFWNGVQWPGQLFLDDNRRWKWQEHVNLYNQPARSTVSSKGPSSLGDGFLFHCLWKQIQLHSKPQLLWQTSMENRGHFWFFVWDCQVKFRHFIWLSCDMLLIKFLSPLSSLTGIWSIHFYQSFPD